jgi:membrane protein YdbS with pleckstrin-like domain
MSIKITINGHEVKNPVARIFLTLVGLVLFVFIFVLLFFLLLPFVWFMALSIVFAMLVLILVIPKLISRYKIILIHRQKMEHHK